MIKEILDEALLKLAQEVNTAILANKFKVIKRREHTIEIEVCNEVVSIWNANEPKNTYCYAIDYGYESLKFPDHTFSKPATCRKILNKQTAEEIAQEQESVKTQIKKLQQKLKD